MRYLSTRGGGPVGLDDALRKGIADDGGLFLPEQLPTFTAADFSTAHTIPVVAGVLLRPFFEGSALAADIDCDSRRNLQFPDPGNAVARARTQDVSLLELYHGPTAAFKDVGARFLAACLSRLEGDPSAPLTILVATSGDTGGAVAAAFDQRPGMRVVVLFPDGRVSARQAHQLIVLER